MAEKGGRRRRPGWRAEETEGKDGGGVHTVLYIRARGKAAPGAKAPRRRKVTAGKRGWKTRGQERLIMHGQQNILLYVGQTFALRRAIFCCRQGKLLLCAVQTFALRRAIFCCRQGKLLLCAVQTFALRRAISATPVAGGCRGGKKEAERGEGNGEAGKGDAETEEKGRSGGRSGGGNGRKRSRGRRKRTADKGRERVRGRKRERRRQAAFPPPLEHLPRTFTLSFAIST